MVLAQDVVPWKCHICQREFDTPGGGICSRCSKATCRKHLRQVSAAWVCERCLTKEEKAKRIFQPKSILRFIVIAAISLLVFGFLIDLFGGFYVLRRTESIYAGLAGLLILGIFYLAGEAGSEWIGGRDKVNDPLYKRTLRLLALLIFAAVVLTVLWLVLK